MTRRDSRFDVTEAKCSVSALLMLPANARVVYALGHGAERGDHLRDVRVPMLFLQGARDRLADLTLLAPLIDELGSNATLHVVDGGDHSFRVLKPSGRNESDVFEELADTIQSWTAKLL